MGRLSASTNNSMNTTNAIMPLLNPMTVFGTIFLVMTIVSGLMMKKEVKNKNCPEEVKAVEYNKKLFPVILAADAAIIILGIILHFI